MSNGKPFTLRVYLTGICAIVPDNADFAAAEGATVVLPGNEAEKPAFSPDNSPLRPHDAMAQFNLADVVGASAARNLKANVPLDGRVVRLDITQADVESDHNRFHIETNGPAGISNLINLDTVAPNHCLVDQSFLVPPLSPLVQCQVLIDQGRLFADKPSVAWRFPGTLSSKPLHPATLAHQAVVELTGLKAAKLVATSFDNKIVETVSFAPGNGNGVLNGERVVEVTIVNSCADCKGTSAIPLPDEDFKWYFNLLSDAQQKDLTATLHGLPLPIPYPVLTAGDPGFINHGNCYPAVAKPAPAALRAAA